MFHWNLMPRTNGTASNCGDQVVPSRRSYRAGQKSGATPTTPVARILPGWRECPPMKGCTGIGWAEGGTKRRRCALAQAKRTCSWSSELMAVCSRSPHNAGSCGAATLSRSTLNSRRTHSSAASLTLSSDRRATHSKPQRSPSQELGPGPWTDQSSAFQTSNATPARKPASA